MPRLSPLLPAIKLLSSSFTPSPRTPVLGRSRRASDIGPVLRFYTAEELLAFSRLRGFGLTQKSMGWLTP